MSILNSLFSSNKNSNDLKLRYSKKENTWRVTKGYAIVYMGEEELCKSYIENVQAMA